WARLAGELLRLEGSPVFLEIPGDLVPAACQVQRVDQGTRGVIEIMTAKLPPELERVQQDIGGRPRLAGDPGHRLRRLDDQEVALPRVGDPVEKLEDRARHLEPPRDLAVRNQQRTDRPQGV